MVSLAFIVGSVVLGELSLGYWAYDTNDRNLLSWSKVLFLKGAMLEQQKMVRVDMFSEKRLEERDDSVLEEHAEGLCMLHELKGIPTWIRGSQALCYSWISLTGRAIRLGQRSTSDPVRYGLHQPPYRACLMASAVLDRLTPVLDNHQERESVHPKVHHRIECQELSGRAYLSYF